ncbi:uncharacterized protein NEMAJ01_1514 [Nematocida major]|uniref:uncharacterized protein n=1 Tax=Nematocida major TaxID=1912982 RepID=UPI002008BA15|nr:uncharacterized protein NEMAJ01_1514 [Nematocida major]KAH9386618.1 hypothetical protein NEMAJ01_1514 [Nematocida major]
MKVYDIVIVGKNISAMTAAIYAGMSKTKTLYINCPNEKIEVTGVNNYLGYEAGTYDAFHENTYKQLMKFQVEKIESNVKKIVIEENTARICIEGEPDVVANALILSTEDVYNKIENKKDSSFIFKCGKLLNNCTEMISLAGTGSMAAIDARQFIAEKK